MLRRDRTGYLLDFSKDPDGWAADFAGVTEFLPMGCTIFSKTRQQWVEFSQGWGGAPMSNKIGKGRSTQVLIEGQF